MGFNIHSFLPTALKGTTNRSPVNPAPNGETYRNKTTGKKKVHKVYVLRMLRADVVKYVLVNATCWLFVEERSSPFKYLMDGKGCTEQEVSSFMSP